MSVSAQAYLEREITVLFSGAEFYKERGDFENGCDGQAVKCHEAE